MTVLVSAATAVVRAYIAHERDVLSALVTSTKDRALRSAGLALAASLMHRPSSAQSEAVSRQLDCALGEPPADPDVQVCLLNAYAHVMPHHRDTVHSVMARLRALLPDLTMPRTRGIVHRWQIALALMDFDTHGALAAAQAGVADAAPDQDLRLEFLCHALKVMLHSDDVAGATPLLNELLPHAERLRAWGLPFDVLRMHHSLSLGNYEAIFAEWDSVLKDFRRLNAYGTILGDAAVFCQRWAMAHQLLDAMATMATELPSQRQFPLARLFEPELAVAERRYDVARRTIQAMLAEAGFVRNSNPTHIILQIVTIGLDLIAGSTAQARAGLEAIDPGRDRGHVRMLWVRLHLQEGDLTGAAAIFADMIRRGSPALVEQHISRAHELSAVSVARLYEAARARGPDSPVPPPPRPRVAALELVGASPAMNRVREEIAVFAPLSVPVLIAGETGTGKEVVARLLHQHAGEGKRPFVALNCAALTDALAEAELFGHRRGSFTGAVNDQEGLFAAANGGTIFLDEINSLSPRLQGLLLRTLESGEYRPIGSTATLRTTARVVAATNADLDQSGFRSDLRFRLQRFVITLPPLRERREDLPALCRHLLRVIGARSDLTCSAELVAVFAAHDWPGNVRELRNHLERIALLAGNRPALTPDDCPDLVRRVAPSPLAKTDVPASVSALALGAPTARMALPGSPRARERRRRILALFDRLPQVYREDVVRELGNAPRTCVLDLDALAEAGLIRRVITSKHLRTSYWVRTA